MKRKYKKIKSFIIFISLLLISIMIFPKQTQIQNKLITENPNKEVTTVIANKNRKHTEMNITVNKLNLVPLVSYKLSDTEFYIQLKKDQVLSQDEVYYISKTIDDIPNISTVNGKKIFSNLNNFKNYNIESKDFIYTYKDNFILIDRAPVGIKEFIITKLNKNTGEIKKVYSTKYFKETPIEKISGVVEPGDTHVVFNLNKEILKELTNKENDMRIGTSFNEILTADTLEKKDNKEALTYNIEVDSSRLLVENKEKLNEVKILVFTKNGIKKIYKGDIFLPSIESNTSTAWTKYSPFKLPKLIGQNDGSYLIQFGHFARGNRDLSLDSYTSDDGRGYNFNLMSNYSMNIDDKNIRNLFGTDVPYRIFSKENSVGEILPPKYLYRDDKPLFGILRNSTTGVENSSSGDLGSYGAPTNKSLNMHDGTVTVGHYSDPNHDVGWYLSWILQIKISKAEYNNMRILGFNRITNIKKIEGKIRSYINWSPLEYIDYSVPLMNIGQLNAEFDESVIPPIKPETLYAQGSIVLKNPIYKKSFEKGGTLVYSNSGDLEAETQSYEQNIKVNTGTILQFRPSLGYLGGNTVNVIGKVIFGDATPHTTNNIILDLNSGNPLKETAFIQGANKISVSYPDSTMNKNGTLLGIDTWNLKAGEYQVKMEHPNFTNTINIILPEFDAGAYYIPIPDKEIVLTKNNREDNKIGEFLLETKNYPIDILGVAEFSGKKTGSLRYKIKKIIPISIDGVQGHHIKLSVEPLIGILSEDTNYWYIHAPDITSSLIKAKINITLDDLLEKKNRIIETIETEPIIQLGLHQTILGASIVLNKIKITETYTVVFKETVITLSNPIFAGTYGAPFGRVRTWLEDSSVKIGRLDRSGNTENINPDYNATIGSNSNTVPVTPEKVGRGTKLTVVINDKIFNKTISWSDLTHPDGLIGSVYYRVGDLDIGVDYQNGVRSKYGTDFSLQSWNLEAQDVNIEMRHEFVTNAFKIKIPRFDGLAYYDYSLGNIEKNSKTYSAPLTNVPLINEIARIYLQTKNYDLRILGSRGGTNSNLEIRIPKIVTLKAKGKNSIGEDIESYDIDFNVEILTPGINTTIDSSLSTHYVLYPKRMEIPTNMSAAIILKGKSRSDITIPKELYGDNLKFVTIGVKDKPDFNKTVIDKIELKGNINTFEQIIDFSDAKKGDTIKGTTPFASLDEHRVELWDGTTSLFPAGTTIATLREGIDIPEAGVSVKYDLNTDNLIYTKIGFKDYSKSNLKLNFLHSGGMLLRTIYLTVKNKSGFEILPGKGSLNFGDFFPGDVKIAENIIEFKNPNNSKITIQLDTNSKEEIYKVGVPITPTTTIPLRNLKVKDLKPTLDTINNSFKISGEAVTKSDTEAGTYKGSLDVTIIIIP